MVEEGFKPRRLCFICELFDERQAGEGVVLVILLSCEERETDDVDPMDHMEHCDEEDEVAREVHRQEDL